MSEPIPYVHLPGDPDTFARRLLDDHATSTTDRTNIRIRAAALIADAHRRGAPLSDVAAVAVITALGVYRSDGELTQPAINLFAGLSRPPVIDKYQQAWIAAATVDGVRVGLSMRKLSPEFLAALLPRLLEGLIPIYRAVRDLPVVPTEADLPHADSTMEVPATGTIKKWRGDRAAKGRWVQIRAYRDRRASVARWVRWVKAGGPAIMPEDHRAWERFYNGIEREPGALPDAAEIERDMVFIARGTTAPPGWSEDGTMYIEEPGRPIPLLPSDETIGGWVKRRELDEFLATPR
jgi:hypothetical protein